MGRIKNIVFDFGGVLVDWNPRYLFDRYFGDPKKAQWFIENICTGKWNEQADRGRPFKVIIDELVEEHPEWENAIRAYGDGWSEMLGGMLPGMYEMVAKCKNAGYGIYGLTNWSAETFRKARPGYPVFDLFDGIVVSGEEKMIKPDHEIWKLLMERYSLRAEECIYIDDNQANVSAAEELGFTALRFITPRLLAEDLEILLGLK